MNRRAFLTSCAAAPLPLFAKQVDSTTTNSATRLAGFLPDSTQVSLAYHTGSTIENTLDDTAEAELNVSAEHQDPNLKFDAVHFNEKPFLVETKYAEQRFEVHDSDDHILGEIVVQAHTVPPESRTSHVITKLHNKVVQHAVSFDSSPSDQLTDWVDTAESEEQVNGQRWSSQWMRYPQIEKWSGQQLSTSKPFAEITTVGYSTEWGVIAVDAEQFDIPRSGLLRERVESILRFILVATSSQELVDPDKSISDLRAEHRQQERSELTRKLVDEDAAEKFP